MIWKRVVLLAACAAQCASTQVTTTELRLHTEPADGRIRPFENAVIQVRVYGEVSDRTGRVRRDGATLKVLDSGGGWISKPFRFQGTDDEAFVEQYESRAGRIFGRVTGEYVLKDSFLYTAPEKPGDYKLEASLAGKTATVNIRVDRSAPSVRKAEKTSFPAEPFSLDPYRELVEHYAPFLAQETWFQPKSDYPTRFDFDGDWDGSNNWESLDEGSSQAYVYYAVMETGTHWFVIYNVFHCRDYSDKCVVGTCHENDNEGIILTVAKDGTDYGRFQVMETLAHNNIYSFVADRRIRDRVHRIDGAVEFYQDSHPVAFIEAGGHGIYGSQSSHARYDFDEDRFTDGTGLTFIYKGVAERPKHANDRLVGYDLLPIYFHWWTKAHSDSGWKERTFDDFIAYVPRGGRLGVPYRSIGGTFFGREKASNKAKPFWGWHDNRTKKKQVLAVGQWGLDPAYAVSQNLRFPQNDAFSLDYLFNPYLKAATVKRPVPAPPQQPTPTEREPVVSGSTRGWFEFRVWIDGSLEAYVQGDRIRYKMLSGAPFRDSEITFSQPFPQAPLRSLRINKKRGRGRVQLLEQPSAQNGYTARLRIDDPKRAGARYHVVLEWER
jgi:hypothetical protein